MVVAGVPIKANRPKSDGVIRPNWAGCTNRFENIAFMFLSPMSNRLDVISGEFFCFIQFFQGQPDYIVLNPGQRRTVLFTLTRPMFRFNDSGYLQAF